MICWSGFLNEQNDSITRKMCVCDIIISEFFLNPFIVRRKTDLHR